MRIIVWGINYAPEETGIGPFNSGMCEWFAKRGHDVEMVSTFTYYPAWRKLPADRWRLYRTERINGVRVRRCWHFVPGKVTSLKRIIHEATFIGSSFLRLLLMKRPDVLIVVSPPLPLGVPARLLSALWRRPYVFHVQDLQPDAAVALGMLKPGIFTRILYGLESAAYRGAALVTGISGGMMRAFASKEVPKEKMALFPNWMREPAAVKSSDRDTAKSRFCSHHTLDPRRPLAVYSGNLGEKQGLSVILDAANCADGSGVQWVIAGDGAGKAALEARRAELALTNVFLLPLQPADRFDEMLRAADACLVTQQRGSGQFFFPSKLLTLLTRGCPVVAVADDSSELAIATKEGAFGALVEPGDAAGLARAVRTVAEAGFDDKRRWSENGKQWVSQFDQDRLLTEFEARLERLTRSV